MDARTAGVSSHQTARPGANIVKDLEGGGDLYDVAGKYNLSDHDGLGDKHGRSEQFINRTEGGSNIYGKSKVAAEPPPIPKEEPRPQPAPKPEPPPMPKPEPPKID